MLGGTLNHLGLATAAAPDELFGTGMSGFAVNGRYPRMDRTGQREMNDPFEKVAHGLNRDLAWIAGGLAALGGAVVLAGFVTVDAVVRRLRHDRDR